jgi:RNA polymerase sigma-70 factor (ECF subfamily)
MQTRALAKGEANVAQGTGSATALHQSWVSRAARGDRRAQEWLFRWYVGPVRRRVRQLMGGDAEAEDVVQETFLVAFRDVRTLIDPQAFRGWLLGIALHLVQRRRRRRRMLQRLRFVPANDAVDVADVPCPAPSPADVADARKIYRLLDGVSPEARMAFLLRAIEGLTVPEIAQWTKLSQRTVRRRIADAGRRLTAALCGLP